MKKIIIGILSFFILWGCNNKGHSENEQGGSGHENHRNDEKPETELSLNNGVRWKADSITLVNVASIREIIAVAGKIAEPDYSQVAEQLQSGLNKMISECKMQGKEHEALHHWLEPLLEKTGELKKTTATAEARKKLKEIEEWAGLFEKYFE